MSNHPTIDHLGALLAERRPNRATDLAAVAPTDWAAIVPQLDAAEVATLVRWLPDDALPAMLAALSPGDAAAIVRTLSRAAAADALEAMPPDDATDVVGALDPGEAATLLAAMEPADAGEVRALLAYPPGTVGSVMSPGFVAVAPDLSANDAIAALRRVAEEADDVSAVFVLDPDDRLLGALSLRRLVLAPPSTMVEALTDAGVPAAAADAPAIDAARLLRDRGLPAIPVIDDAGRLVGVLSADDAGDLLEDELEEDFFRLAGSDAEEMDRRTPLQVARLRLPWLLGTMGLELVAGLVIARFAGVLQQVILLASFMPVISAISGNVGLQAAAIVVRGLDTGHVSLNRWRRQLGKELRTALVMAAVCGVVLGTIGAAWSRHPPFGIVIGVALACSMTTAGLMGTLIPMLSKRLGFDPAATAGPFETAFQDVIGFGVFLWLASLLVDWLV